MKAGRTYFQSQGEKKAQWGTVTPGQVTSVGDPDLLETRLQWTGEQRLGDD